MNKKSLVVSLMALAAFCPLYSQADKKEGIALKSAVRADKKIQTMIGGFKTLDFDGRSEYREYLLQKENLDFSFYLLKVYMPDLTIEDEIKYNTIMSLGRTLPEIKGKDIGAVAKECGFHRVRDFYEFKKNPQNKGKFFLDDKKPLYASGLMAEMREFVEVSNLFNLKDWLSLRYNIMQENWRYSEKHPKFLRLYNEHLQQKVNIRIQNEKKNLQVKSR